MKEDTSDLHKKILNNMEAEANHIGKSMDEHEEKTKLLMAPKKGFFQKIIDFFSGK
ncbi:MAG TPA: hypothetical protein VFF13_00760 [archaeon]|nr:hypothetical protein [archaeon]